MAETKVQWSIMLALSKVGAKIFRNNVGMAKMKDGSWLRYGLCNGSSDLIGWRTVTITPDMVGKRVAVFLAVEVKDKGRLSDEQRNFIDTVKAAGGLAGVARSDAQAVALLGQNDSLV